LVLPLLGGLGLTLACSRGDETGSTAPDAHVEVGMGEGDGSTAWQEVGDCPTQADDGPIDGGSTDAGTREDGSQTVDGPATVDLENSDEAGDAGTDAEGGPAELEATAVEVRRYAYHLDLASQRMDTELSMWLAPPGGNCVVLPSRSPPSGTGWWDGAPANVTHDGAHIRACSGHAPQTGAAKLSMTVQLREEHDPQTPQVGFYRKTDGAGYAVTELVSWLAGCDRYGPCDKGVGRQAEIEILVDHAPGETVLCPGARRPGLRSTRCSVAGGLQAPLYSGLTIIAHPALTPNEWISDGDTRVVLFETSQQRLSSTLDRAFARGALQYLTKLLGALPYGPELRVAGVPLGWLGLEPPANILLDDALPDQSPRDYARPAQHTFVHELVHQWAGDRTTPAGVHDVVWKEAIAEYLTYLIEESDGQPGEAEATRMGWQRSARLASYWPFALDPEAPPAVLVTNAYSTGPMTLFIQLEPLLGRESLLRGVKSFLREPGVRSMADFREALERESGVSLATYWRAWVEGMGEPPRPVLRIEPGDGLLRVSQMQETSPFPCVVELELEGVTKRTRVEARFDLASPQRVVEARHQLGEPLAKVTIDPDHRLLWLAAP
jgi:aminopeptidase N